MPLMEISIVPVGTHTPSFSNMVKDVCRMVEQSGLHYQITPTATVIEGDLERLMDVAREIHRSSMQNGTNRVITQITIDDRRDQPISLESQVAKVNGDVH
ncbi:MTH1187 family thiamine-binding protein [Polycladomyces sp. WAk]|uniref:MTH1187 family thiamine-binding protein n=1 Tax=Polycladomyces zharkentensis TaxID=2807616 RepID=A0ABS2WG92_9BACL|nr:MTH1187 family thiamine-binding protein [Polycladomyces sp. WAk]MBN2908509.1 MTH1187 family thiamine-binding protein [Polycladomyces sp. WAk]